MLSVVFGVLLTLGVCVCVCVSPQYVKPAAAEWSGQFAADLNQLPFIESEFAHSDRNVMRCDACQQFHPCPWYVHVVRRSALLLLCALVFLVFGFLFVRFPPFDAPAGQRDCLALDTIRMHSPVRSM